jgi:hypothetical protein
MAELSKDNLLRSWKEIAAYLGCDVRTCHRWEDRRGMPVHRAEGGETKSPVFAYKDELDRWFQGTFKTSTGHAVTKAASRRWLRWAVPGAALLVAAGATFWFPGLLLRRQPADFAIEGSELVILDKHKHEIGRADLEVEDLRPESYYRESFQVRNPESANILPSLVMKDIDGDGDKEVLFALSRVLNQTGEGVLVCFDRRGRERWRFQAGRELVCRSKRFSPDYRIAGFYCHDIDGDGKLETVVESIQAPDWPCQLALLDADGRMIGEFWNAGYLRDLTYWDINGDGREELIVCGVNNEYKGGCLIVFDPRRIAGGSPQSGDFVCQGIGPGSMLYYVTTPYIDVSEALGYAVDGLRQVNVTKNDWIRATGGNGLFYEFDFGLRPIQAFPGHGFMALHEEARKAGGVTSVLGDAYWKALLDGIRFWNGSAWTPEPSMVRH